MLLLQLHSIYMSDVIINMPGTHKRLRNSEESQILNWKYFLTAESSHSS